MEAGRRSVQASMARSLTCTRIPAMFLLVLLLFLGDFSTPTAHGVVEDNGDFTGSHVHPSFLDSHRGLRVQPTIVGGGAINRSAAPYQVYLEINHPLVQSFCGGVLIDPQYVVSAAHCNTFDTGAGRVRVQPKHLSVRVGSVYRLSGGEVIGVRRVWQHPGYIGTEDNKNYDVTLIKLQRPVKISWNSIPIKLSWNDRKLKQHSDIAITGWGDTMSGGVPSQVLLGATIDNLPDGCKGYFSKFNPRVMICAGCSQGGVDACQGDSGGAAVVSSSSKGCPILVGVTSFGKGCALPDYPTAYTRISAVVDWLEKKARKSFRSQYTLAPHKNCESCSAAGEGPCGWVPKFNLHKCRKEAWMAAAFVFRLRTCLKGKACPKGPQARMKAYFKPSSMGSFCPVGRVYFLQGRSGKGVSVLRLDGVRVTVPLRGPVISRCAHQIRKGYWSIHWCSYKARSACSSFYKYAAVFVSRDKKLVQVSYPAGY